LKSPLTKLIVMHSKKINPEKIVVIVNNASSGVLLKEFYFKDWHAYLEVDGKKMSELKIFRAGPNFMYSRLGKWSTLLPSFLNTATS